MEFEIQDKIDHYVKQKLLLYKEIDELASGMEKKVKMDVIEWWFS